MNLYIRNEFNISTFFIDPMEIKTYKKIKNLLKSVSLVYIFFCALNLSAQTSSIEKQEIITKKFVQAYNQKNYKELKSYLFLLGKILISEKKLAESFTEINDNWGKFTVVKLAHQTNSKVIAQLASEKDPTETENFIFSFNKKNKIVSFFIKNLDFIYPDSNDISQPILTSQAKIHKIDSLIYVKNSRGHFNGCVLVIDSGNIIYKKCYGYSDFQNKLMLNDSSVFELASCSKQFTAFAIMMLAEEGKLNISDNIQKYIPELPYNNITIENLLTHTSGLPDYMSELDKFWDKKKFATNADIVTVLKMHKPKLYFKPGERFDYSNTGYALLSLIIEKASNNTYAGFLEDKIFKPIGMRNTRIYNTRRSKSETITNYAYGYVYSDSLKRYIIPDSLMNYQYVVYMDAITGDGTVNTTISDLAKWDKCLREYTLVKKSTMDISNSNYTLKNGQKTGYGYGVFVIDNKRAKRIVHHGGSWPGYHTFILRFMDTNKTIAILSNNEYISFNQLADKISKILLNISIE